MSGRVVLNSGPVDLKSGRVDLKRGRLDMTPTEYDPILKSRSVSYFIVLRLKTMRIIIVFYIARTTCERKLQN